MKKALVFLSLFCFVQLGNAESNLKTYQFINGNWFNGKSFKKDTFYSVNGFFTNKNPTKIDETVDLKNGFVIPPFGDSHTHSFDSRFNILQQIQDSLRDGVFYAKVLNNFRSRAAGVKNEVNTSDSIDVQYAHGGLTGNYSHPIEVYESLSLGIFSYQQQLASAELIWRSRKAENDAYFIVDSLEDLENKWPKILEGTPDFIKVFLRNSEVYEQRRGFVPKEWRRFDGGVNPKLVPIIVKKAHKAGLRVSVATNSVHDYRVAINAKANEISHLPCYQLIDEGEECAIPAELARLTAKYGIFVTLVATEYEKERDVKISEFDRQNLGLLKKCKVKFTVGSNSYGTTPVKGAIAMSRTGSFTNLELLKIWVENTPNAIFPNRKLGHLKQGYEASFVVLKGDPLVRFEEVQNIVWRFKQGGELRLRNPG